jgi:hypothetical protein
MQGPNSKRDCIHAMGRKIEFLNWFTDSPYYRLPNLIWQKLVVTLQIGDHFFLNLGSVLMTFHCSLFAKLQNIKKPAALGANSLLRQALGMPIPSSREKYPRLAVL